MPRLLHVALALAATLALAAAFIRGPHPEPSCSDEEMSYVYSRKPPMAEFCKYEMTTDTTGWSLSDHHLGKKRKSEVGRD